MNKLLVQGREIALDKEGYLRNLEDWSPAVAEQLAGAEKIELTEAHWEVIRLLQAFYKEFELSPAMRPLVKYIGQHLGAEKGKSIYLMQLFPPSPAKVASKIAGLPKPTNCL
ncbi:TusE/DsrC/DsvC family sulfur relay protein [Microbulbifer thermotolerans]|uniref:Sulfurtransferase n=1 Tax=Microbulbifer thermotolerans TaxID=252514 RepID=A0A143HMH9_MICTH|nr:TusE/DsrC/DsvC family sulfur relay protein [Microbulbifer thermotolerans]AMX02482.1 sulfur relay protein TusE [Microbulbifer thermotolerans]MCX2779332.1 TusE/DsrC/DsvC family sulfur relay protein [Microbulbifer thermotolerans]MCX2782464.1 TusE/DsrC/DsvC family sulfur relay protein [Microbulbifer thermotolerans]MCX2795049.1 TusE/DsrC/DsvC family sulfur relay protein [Microbulbifer thermotolerans]MCX2800617.1 TusE/DsrC/DsvC family sulfur relay protein [Microbulbifer thermotolerans]